MLMLSTTLKCRFENFQSINDELSSIFYLGTPNNIRWVSIIICACIVDLSAKQKSTNNTRYKKHMLYYLRFVNWARLYIYH